MTGRVLITEVPNTWCPGCGNFTVQHTLKTLLAEREAYGMSLDDVVLVSGIGCHAKIVDYLNINSFYTLHGRTIPMATGIKLANPDLTGICCCGDRDCYAEGLDHLIFAAKRSIDITVIVHNNPVYGPTTGKYTPTSSLGFRGKSTPLDTAEFPRNPVDLMLESGLYEKDGPVEIHHPRRDRSPRLLVHRRAPDLRHILPGCGLLRPRVYEPADHDTSRFDVACALAREWDYNADARIALGLISHSL